MFYNSHIQFSIYDIYVVRILRPPESLGLRIALSEPVPVGSGRLKEHRKEALTVDGQNPALPIIRNIPKFP